MATSTLKARNTQKLANNKQRSAFRRAGRRCKKIHERVCECVRRGDVGEGGGNAKCWKPSHAYRAALVRVGVVSKNPKMQASR
jgi:hypothetical protein